MIHVIIFIFLGLIYFSLPFLLQLIITVINTWLIDPIPIIDEIIMYGGLISKLMSGLEIFEKIVDYKIWCEEHRFLGILTTIFILTVIVALGCGIWKLVVYFL